MRYLISVLALAGVVVSALALHVHFCIDPQPCSINERWDCGVVNHSPFAEIAHIPVAEIGIAGYLALAALAFWRQRALVFLCALVGLGFALRLTTIEELVLADLVPLLRDLAGDYRADYAAQFGMGGDGVSDAEAGVQGGMKTPG